jgi:hypothetical protein
VNAQVWQPYQLRQKAIDAAAAINYSREDFLRVEQDLTTEGGGAPDPGEVFWSLANRALSEAGAQGNWERLHDVYVDQARWLHEEGRRSPYTLLRDASIALLRDCATRWGMQAKVQVLACDDGAVCASNRGKTWTVAEALENPPVPHPDCANGFCRCRLGLVVLEP